MPALILAGGSAVFGLVAGLFTSEVVGSLIKLVLVVAAFFGLFYAYKAVKG